MVAAQKITNLRGLSAGIDTGWAVQVCNQRVRLPHRRLVSSIFGCCNHPDRLGGCETKEHLKIVFVSGNKANAPRRVGKASFGGRSLFPWVGCGSGGKRVRRVRHNSLRRRVQERTPTHWKTLCTAETNYFRFPKKLDKLKK